MGDTADHGEMSVFELKEQKSKETEDDPTRIGTETKEWLQKIPAGLRPLMSVLVIFLSRLFFTVANIEVRRLQNLDAFIIHGIANVVVSILAWVCCILGNQPLFPKGYRFILTIRGVFSAFTFVVYAYAVKHMPMGDMSVIITAASPLVVFMAWILLGEPVQFNDLLNLLVTTVGIMLVAQPPMIFGHDSNSHRDSQYGISTLLVIISCFALAMCYILMRMIKEVPSMTVVFLMGLETALFSFAGHIVMNPEHSFQINLMDFLSTAYIGVLIFLVQTTMIIGSQIECAGLAAILSQTFGVALAFAAQLFIYQEYPNTFGVAGISLVVMVIADLTIRKIVEGMEPNHKLRRAYECVCCVPWPCIRLQDDYEGVP